MAIKTTIGPKGVVTTKIPGTLDILTVTTQKNVVTVAAGSNSAADAADIVVMQPGAAGVTASLPAIGVGNLGKEVWVLSQPDANPLLITGSNGIGGTTWTLAVSSSAAVQLLAVSTSVGGYRWHILQQRNI
jgi:hypothetical protein